LVWIGTDFWEFLYHYGGHTNNTLWSAHKPHHQFFNPSPFAVIADEYLDQFMRALPLLLFPLVMPINMDMIFFEYATFFYGTFLLL
jgi:lathosterol oxidase